VGETVGTPWQNKRNQSQFNRLKKLSGLSVAQFSTVLLELQLPDQTNWKRGILEQPANGPSRSGSHPRSLAHRRFGARYCQDQGRKTDIDFSDHDRSFQLPIASFECRAGSTICRYVRLIRSSTCCFVLGISCFQNCCIVPAMMISVP